MKNTLSLLLVILMLTSLVGCGNSTSYTPTTSVETTETTPVEITEATSVETTATIATTESASSGGGIIVLSAKEGDNYTYNSTGTFKLKAFTVNLDLINPETGATTHLRTFSSEDTQSCSAGTRFSDQSLGTEFLAWSFNSDYTKMTATLSLEDNAAHVGWIDEIGNFTDVSAMIETSSDFAGLTMHLYPRFFENYFYFMDASNNKFQVKRVPLENLTSGAVETVIDEYHYAAFLHIAPDGSVLESNSAINVYYDSSLTYAANRNFFCDWVSESVCVGAEDGLIYKYNLDPDGWYSNRTALIPEINGRNNRSAVVSPDSNQVAFLSNLSNSTNTSPSIYIVSINGGDPVKVNTNLSLSGDETIHLLTWK